MTTAEARRSRKEMRGPKLSREERREDKVERRAAMADRRERMMAGEDAYLLPRDKGPVRRVRPRHRGLAPHTCSACSCPRRWRLIFIMLAVPQVQLLHLPGHAGPDGDHGGRRTPRWAAR